MTACYPQYPGNTSGTKINNTTKEFSLCLSLSRILQANFKSILIIITILVDWAQNTKLPVNNQSSEFLSLSPSPPLPLPPPHPPPPPSPLTSHLVQCLCRAYLSAEFVLYLP